MKNSDGGITKCKTPDAVGVLHFVIPPSVEGVKVTKNKQFFPANVVGKWKRKYRGWTVEEAWFILTNLAYLKLALSAYQKRFCIEECSEIIKVVAIILNLQGAQVIV